MIPLVEPEKAFSEGGRVKGQAPDPPLIEAFEKGTGGIKAADIVIDEKYFHPPLYGGEQSLGKTAAGSVVLDDVKLEHYQPLGFHDSLKHGRHQFAPLAEKLHRIAARYGSFRVPPEEVEKPGRADAVMPPFMSQKNHAALAVTKAGLFS